MAKTSRHVRHPIVCGAALTPPAFVTAGPAVALRHPWPVVHAAPPGGWQLRAGAGQVMGVHDGLPRVPSRVPELGSRH